MNKMTVRDISLEGKHVLMRVDFNVPMANGVVTDDKRIKAALPTIQYVIDQGASLVLMSHLGRPKGTGFEPDFSLKAASEALATSLGKPVQMAPDCVGPDVEAIAKALKPGDVLMLENTRFHKSEEKNDLDLARQMAALGDVYVNDAFGSAHRAHASTEGVARFLPAVSGFLMEQELEYLQPGASLRRHPRGSQGQRQNRRDREFADAMRHVDHRRWHGQHLPGRQGLQHAGQLGGSRLCGDGQGDHGEGR
jgi:phosphoglycerate kinase